MVRVILQLEEVSFVCLFVCFHTFLFYFSSVTELNVVYWLCVSPLTIKRYIHMK